MCRGSQGPLLAAFGANYVDYKAFKNVYIYVCVYIYKIYLAALCNMWDLSSLTRD